MERRRQRPLIQLERLSKAFEFRTGLWSGTRLLRAVDNVSLFIRHSESLGLIGPSGSGKSTLAKVMLRLIKPTYGRILVDERDITHLPESRLRSLRRDLQILPQNASAALDPSRTVGHYLAESFEIHRVFSARSEVEESVAALLEQAGIGAHARTAYPAVLSVGQRQRLALARTLAMQPRFVILDEPTRGLGMPEKTRLVEDLRNARHDRRLAALVISQDLELIRRICQRVCVMYLGQLVEVAPAAELFRRRAHPYTHALLDAAPSDGPARPRLRILLEGKPPDPLSPPRGCAFHLQCPRAEKGRCDVHAPELRVLDGDSRYRVACHHPYG